MTKEKEILNMPAGREMDTLVAKKVMGWERDFDGIDWVINPETWKETGGMRYRFKKTWNPSTSISAAWEVVEQMKKSNWKWFEMDTGPNGWRVNFVGDPQYNVYAETAPLAICWAALLVAMEEEND